MFNINANALDLTYYQVEPQESNPAAAAAGLHYRHHDRQRDKGAQRNPRADLDPPVCTFHHHFTTAARWPARSLHSILKVLNGLYSVQDGRAESCPELTPRLEPFEPLDGSCKAGKQVAAEYMSRGKVGCYSPFLSQFLFLPHLSSMDVCYEDVAIPPPRNWIED